MLNAGSLFLAQRNIRQLQKLCTGVGSGKNSHMDKYLKQLEVRIPYLHSTFHEQMNPSVKGKDLFSVRSGL